MNLVSNLKGGNLRTQGLKFLTIPCVRYTAGHGILLRTPSHVLKSVWLSEYVSNPMNYVYPPILYG